MSIRDIIEALREFAYDNRPRHWKVRQVKCSVAIQQLDDLAKEVALMETERDALLAEHEAVAEGYGDETDDGRCGCLSCRIIRAHNNAKRVMHSE